MNISLVPLWMKVVGVLLLLLGIYLGARMWLGNRDQNQNNAVVAAQVPKDAVATKGVVDDAATAREGAAVQESVVAESRVTFHHVYEEAKRNDPVIRNWGTTPIPERLRDIARDRAQQRERAGSDASGSGGNGEAASNRGQR